jgi:branched-subunit amino acid transport protein
MSAFEIWTIIIGLGIVTYLIRLSFIASRRGRINGTRLAIALKYIPVAVLAALVAPAWLLNADSNQTLAEMDKLLAGIAAIGAAYYFKNAALTIIVGMGTLYLARAIIM